MMSQYFLNTTSTILFLCSQTSDNTLLHHIQNTLGNLALFYFLRYINTTGPQEYIFFHQPVFHFCGFNVITFCSCHINVLLLPPFQRQISFIIKKKKKWFFFQPSGVAHGKQILLDYGDKNIQFLRAAIPCQRQYCNIQCLKGQWVMNDLESQPLFIILAVVLDP